METIATYPPLRRLAALRPATPVDMAGRDAMGRWKSGFSGNQAGRPLGARDTYQRVRCEPFRPYRRKGPPWTWKPPRYKTLSPLENINRAIRLIEAIDRDAARRRR